MSFVAFLCVLNRIDNKGVGDYYAVTHGATVEKMRKVQGILSLFLFAFNITTHKKRGQGRNLLHPDRLCDMMMSDMKNLRTERVEANPLAREAPSPAESGAAETAFEVPSRGVPLK